MNQKDLLGRVLMTAAAFSVGVGPIGVDVNATHLLNPSWPAHARVHEVWLLGSAFLVSLVALYLIWLQSQSRRLAVVLATLIIASLCGGILIAGLTVSLYAGVMVDPATAHLMPSNDRVMGLPGNVFSAIAALLLLLIGAALCMPGRMRNET